MKSGNELSDPTIFGEPVVLSLLDNFFSNLDLTDNIAENKTEKEVDIVCPNIVVPETDEEDINEVNNNTVVAETDNEEDQENANLDQGAESNTPMYPTPNPSPAKEEGNMNDETALAFLLQASAAENLMTKSPESEIIPPSIEEIEKKLLDFEESGDEYEPPKDSSKDMFDSSYTSASSVYSGKLLHPIC